MSEIGAAAMVLAAGLGHRMRPLTDTRPKPLVEVGGKPLIEYGFDRLRAAGIKKAVINVHYHPEQIEAWARRQNGLMIEISDERGELLDTGGGIAKALPRLGSAPFYVLNSDSFWIDGPEAALARLRNAWNDLTMDCLLLLCPKDRALGYDGSGDFILSGDGRLHRRAASDDDALVYIGAYLIHPRLFAEAPPGKFSMNLLWDEALQKERLFGISHTGRWIHVGTPEALETAEKALAE